MASAAAARHRCGRGAHRGLSLAPTLTTDDGVWYAVPAHIIGDISGPTFASTRRKDHAAGLAALATEAARTEELVHATLYSPMYSDDSSSDDSYVSTNYNEADTPVVNDSSAPSTMPSAALANLTGPDTPASSRPGPSGVSPVPASKRLRGWESDEEDDEA